MDIQSPYSSLFFLCATEFEKVNAFFQATEDDAEKSTHSCYHMATVCQEKFHYGQEKLLAVTEVDLGESSSTMLRSTQLQNGTN